MLRHITGEYKYVPNYFNNPEHEDKCGSIVGGADEFIIAEVCNDAPLAKGNAVLLASAPELLAAAKLAMTDCCDLLGTDAGNALEAAIAKAEGR